MTKEVQFRRGTSTDHSTFTGAAGEITINTDRNVPVVHNGTTAGGFEVVGLAATQTLTNKDLRIGTATSTGTANQRLQVSGGAYVSGSIGIGTTNPQYTIDVIGTGRIGLTTSSILIANDAGRSIEVGAGTTTLDCYIDLHGADGVYSDYASRLLRITGANSAFNIINRGTGSLALIAQDAGSIDFSTQNILRGRVDSLGNFLVGTSSSTATASQPLQVTGGAYVSGNLGIGTTNPSTKLDVVGLGQFLANGATLNLIGTDHTYIQWYPDGVAAGRKAYTGFSGSTANYFEIANEISDGTGHLYLNPGTNASVLIDSFTPTGTASQPLQVTGGAYVSGNLGIGVTNPTSAISVQGNASITGVTTSLGGFVGNVSGNINSSGVSTFSNGPVFIGSATSTATASQSLQVTGGAYISNNTGIATTNPTAELHIVGLGTTTPSSAPFKISVQTPTLLNTPEADAFEYDNVLLYHTNNDTTNGNKRALIPEIQFIRRTSDLAITDITSPGTSFFGATTRPAMLGGYIYEIEGLFYVTKVSNSGTITIQFSLSTGNFTFATFHAPTGGVTSFVNGGTTSPVNAFTTGTLAGGTTNALFIKGLFQPASNSRLDVLAFSSTASLTAVTNSYLKLTCMGTGGNIGNIA